MIFGVFLVISLKVWNVFFGFVNGLLGLVIFIIVICGIFLVIIRVLWVVFLGVSSLLIILGWFLLV